MFLLFAPPTLAGTVLEGEQLRVYYNDEGTWNDDDIGRGVQYLHDDWVDWTYAGYPWQMLAADYTVGDERLSFYTNSYAGTENLEILATDDLSTGALLIQQTTYGNDDLEVVQTQSWARGGRDIRVTLNLTAFSDVTSLSLYFEVDPDPDALLGDYTSVNDTFDATGDGEPDLAYAQSPNSGYTLAFGTCDPSVGTVGHNANWSSATSSRVTLVDAEATTADSALGYRYATASDLDAGESLNLAFVVLEDASLDVLTARWTRDDLCGPCDADEDGFEAQFCGGADCDDADAATNPAASESYYDGNDQNCDGADDYDQDGDGFTVDDDCDDTQAAAYPGNAEVLYDGIDGDCSGGSDYDADGDGYDSDDFGGDDCNDNDRAINPAAAEVYYDDVDQNCDGNDDDADGDGFDSPLDCDDTNPAIYPEAPGAAGDGVDSDCDGSDQDAAADTDLGVKINDGCGCSGTPAAGVLGGLFTLAAIWRRRTAPPYEGSASQG